MSRNSHGLLTEIHHLWRAIVRMINDPYRPEHHYMRGDGPKTQARSRFFFEPMQSRPQPVLAHIRAARSANNNRSRRAD